MFVAVAFLNMENVFKNILEKFDHFKTLKPDWYVLFSQPQIFKNLQAFPSMAERNTLNAIALNILLEKDLEKLTEIMLEQSVITPEMISILIKHNQSQLVIGLLDRPIRPKFINTAGQMGKKKTNVNLGVEHKIRFHDVVVSMLDKGHKSYEIIDLIKKLSNYIDVAKPKAQFSEIENDEPERTIHDELNYNELYELFIIRRKIRLLRHVFGLPN